MCVHFIFKKNQHVQMFYYKSMFFMFIVKLLNVRNDRITHSLEGEIRELIIRM